MLGGQKPWIKILAENFLLYMTLLAILLTRIAGKIIYNTYSIWNLLALLISFIGLIFLILSKKEKIKRKEFFTFGSSNMNEKEKKLYQISYILMIVGILLTFTV